MKMENSFLIVAFVFSVGLLMGVSLLLVVLRNFLQTELRDIVRDEVHSALAAQPDRVVDETSHPDTLMKASGSRLKQPGLRLRKGGTSGSDLQELDDDPQGESPRDVTKVMPVICQRLMFLVFRCVS